MRHFYLGLRTARRDKVVTIVGKHCESGDKLIIDAHIPEETKIGDVLATPVTGAYGYTMASNYNRVTKPAVVMVKDGQARLILRRETFADLLIARSDVVARRRATGRRPEGAPPRIRPTPGLTQLHVVHPLTALSPGRKSGPRSASPRYASSWIPASAGRQNYCTRRKSEPRSASPAIGKLLDPGVRREDGTDVTPTKVGARSLTR